LITYRKWEDKALEGRVTAQINDYEDSIKQQFIYKLLDIFYLNVYVSTTLFDRSPGAFRGDFLITT